MISALDVSDLARGKKHMFYFQGVQMPTGQHGYVSAVVVCGAKPGKRVALIDVGIPAITPEIGSERVFDFDMIPLFVEGTMNVLKRYGVVTGPMGRTGRDVGIFVGNSAHGILSTHGGFVELLVKLNDKVKAGQKVAIQRNAFGEVVAEYTTGVAGEVTGRRIDATAEPRIPLMMILYQSPGRENPEDYVE
ncbi:succinylglutamate desuccinylase/aspartoacylase family protein [Paraburkholderia unamae]|uniref:Succinylglutamate desuccinylase/aspartoacylase family protein n=1 Tax=Paraburkholderia unamae TaxID=219649 RepID=A0ABX5KK28_9BURK|nr:succinylglutamate desuccinylase/aspartoacylase family protein [Paraburkholderia unamae]PVX79864.1 succinylglutamate desuccinylase/aspartoacylase family protein [Paraburkholderia unamae]